MPALLTNLGTGTVHPGGESIASTAFIPPAATPYPRVRIATIFRIVTQRFLKGDSYAQ
ncbi:hypothetical protein LAUMK7_04539 [Mycobacterium kansasii]|uniref:Uncharacterized protein n=1 Tax=Mycobacterium kansasii TaxID=1768 RepID=A0A653F5Z6_MYCKA|nr:hypothetical protein MKANGN_29060 [Mycobacterium kansasii]VAZ62089.1 hypothetical protein LAUMK22_03909 [Mycobacterium kansasii]VAZ68524.1 hypothetical protein LAUMK40_04676 [Mycobacterium kansasii]VAZ78877.1 hypothetical protein LAUMK7_04539 [Mycobacterium kansasii]VTP05205.1 hypothetical protein BIN_B_05047 [Mycobacterium kansasii]